MESVRRAIVASALTVACAVLGAGRATGQIIFEEDFETSVTNVDGTISLWDGPPNPGVMYLTESIAHLGRRSLELKYLPGSVGASFMYRHIPGQDHIYVRWYQRWSAGFVWEPSSTKMLILTPYSGYPQFYPEILWANGQLAIQAQGIAEANWDSRNFPQNEGEPVVFGTNRWYCIEVFVKLNTPGAADGELAAWLDGELKLSYTGRQFRGSSPIDIAPSTARIEAVVASGHYGGVTAVPQLQFAWQDDLVASTQRIGCRVAASDFEWETTNHDGTLRQWDGPADPSALHITDQVARSGGRSLELKYAPGSQGASYVYKHLSYWDGGWDRLYHRWYQRWSPGFVWELSGTGLVGLRPYYGYPHFYPAVLRGAGELAIQAQGIAEAGWDTRNYYQNRGDPVSFEPDRWYCLEVFVKLNTPGAADGELAAWIDGELKLLHTGRQFRGAVPDDLAPPTARMQALLIDGHYGDSPVPQQQFSWQDDFVTSTERIGCQPLTR